jgi:hypothetical protein
MDSTHWQGGYLMSNESIAPLSKSEEDSLLDKFTAWASTLSDREREHLMHAFAAGLEGADDTSGFTAGQQQSLRQQQPHFQQSMASLRLMGEILSNVSKTRSEISMTFARNSRA